MTYYIVEVGRYDEFEIGKTDVEEKAVDMARDRWERMTKHDRKENTIEIRVYKEDIEDEDCTCFDYDTIAWKERKSMKYVITDPITGTIIDAFKSKEDAVAAVEKFEERDKKDGCYTEDFYEISEMSEITVIRKDLDISQKEFAEMYGIPVRTVQNWENGVNEPPAYLVSLLNRVTYAIPTAYVFYSRLGDAEEAYTFTDREEAVEYGAQAWAALDQEAKTAFLETPDACFGVTLRTMAWEDDEYVATDEILENVWSAR